MIEHAYLIVLLPLISALVIFFLGRWLPAKGAPLGIAAIGYGLIHSLCIFFNQLGNPSFTSEMSLSWFRFGIYQTELGMVIDGLSAAMLVVVTLVSFLVQVYSLGYMHGDPRFKRYYSYLSFFTFAMLVLVVANNFLQIFIGWELVGLASYLLIGFWFEKTSAANAGRKAFITTKLGDLGFFVGIMMIFSLLGTLNFNQVQGRIQDGLISPHVAGVIALLLFCGAIGKSAQFPLHIWLPDAMEGPTPVSALIHAATMVAAGVYLVARTYFIFAQGAFALETVAWIGGITAIFAASMALVTTDIKRVLAFSTVSQLGYMILAMGVGAREAGMFHLMTHAFFKALLFLGAGSVIHAVHTNDIREMGGLSRKMIWTFWTFSFAWIAICGIWPFAGFFSKDAILDAAWKSGHTALFGIGVFTAFLTAFYMTRLYLLVFVTEPRNIEIFSHAHESPASMVAPLTLLALLSLGSGMALKYVWDVNKLFVFAGHIAAYPAPEPQGFPDWFVPGISLLAAASGIALSVMIYVKKIFSADRIAQTFRPAYQILWNKYWVDEFYINGLVKPADALSRAMASFDLGIFDRLVVDGVGRVTIVFSETQRWFDDNIVDGLVNLWGKIIDALGAVSRRIQTGLVQNYLLVFLLGLGLLVIYRLRINFTDLLQFF